MRRGDKAWTQGNANPYSVAVELCAFASWDGPTWARHPVMLENCAAWIAEEAAHYGIPLVRLTAAEAQSGHRGVCGHNELGAAGGGHWDPGPAFPWADVLRMALVGSSTPAPAPPPPTTTEENDAMAISLAWNGGRHVFSVGPNGRLTQRWEVGTTVKDWRSATIGGADLRAESIAGARRAQRPSAPLRRAGGFKALPRVQQAKGARRGGPKPLA